jgi:hypothetical protein
LQPGVAHRRFLPFLLLAGIAGFFGACAGKQLEQVRVRFIPESRHTVFIGLPINNTALPELPRMLQDGLSEHYQTSRELTLTRDFPSADLYLELEIVQWLESPALDLKTGTRGQGRYLLKCLASFRDIKTREYYLKEKTIEISLLGPNRRAGEPLSPDVVRPLLARMAYSLDSLVVSGSAPVIGQYGYEGLEDNLGRGWFERQNLGSDTRSRDFRDRPESDFTSLSNDSESNRLRYILDRDRRGLR